MSEVSPRWKGEVDMPVVVEGVKSLGKVYCTLCTRTVDAEIIVQPNLVYRKANLKVAAGQKCPRCSSSLDAAFVVGPSN
jgi:hypothetical protein